MGDRGTERERTEGHTPRCVKDELEDDLFARRRDLFTGLDQVFFDTTWVYLHGEGGRTLGRHSQSKDYRPEGKQAILGMALDREGCSLCAAVDAAGVPADGRGDPGASVLLVLGAGAEAGVAAANAGGGDKRRRGRR